MDLEQEIERIAKKYNYMIFGEVARQDFSKALREMAAFTRKHTLEELRGMCLEIQSGGCDKIKTAYPCQYCYAAYRLEKEKGEEQP